MAIAYQAGVKDGARHVVWSTHRSEAAAIRAARRYAKQAAAQQGSSPGYAGAWSGFWRADGGSWVECPASSRT